MDENDQEKGQKLLNAVERIVMDTEGIRSLVSAFQARERSKLGSELTDEDLLDPVSNALISHFARLSAASGGVSSLPALIPGAGSILALIGGTLADMAFMLKFEVEMSLALTDLHGFDISQPDERQLAFLLASVSTYEAGGGKNLMDDLAQAQAVAIWNYAPREITKLLLQTLTRIALMQFAKRVTRIIPVVGIALGGIFNHTLTRNVGMRIQSELINRRRIKQYSGTDGGEIVDAVVTHQD